MEFVVRCMAEIFYLGLERQPTCTYQTCIDLSNKKNTHERRKTILCWISVATSKFLCIFPFLILYDKITGAWQETVWLECPVQKIKCFVWCKVREWSTFFHFAAPALFLPQRCWMIMIMGGSILQLQVISQNLTVLLRSFRYSSSAPSPSLMYNKNSNLLCSRMD